MAPREDYYRILGVHRGASAEEIKRAYRKLARQLHPDVTGDDPKATERFKLINEAYETLSDPKRRRNYDLFGPPSGARGVADEPPLRGFADLFDDVLKRTRGPAGPEPGIDLERPLSITFDEAIAGTEKQIDIDAVRACKECEGKGWPKDKPPERCTACNGTGREEGGLLPFKRSCQRCDGQGTVRRYSCKACAGEGAVRESERLKVTVPAGVDTGTRLRIKNKGEAGRRGGPNGDLYVVVDVLPDARFERDGTDVRTELVIGLKQALLGGKVTVPLPDGEALMTIPPGTQGGQVFRIRARGFSKLGSTARGDVLVTVQLRVPKKLSDDAKALVEQLAERVPEL